MALQRCWIDEPPPKRKTFFLIRHGQSKWNEAQSKINIPGMLDRDHPLTELGIQQAMDLNKRWRQQLLLHNKPLTGGASSSAGVSPKKRTPEKDISNNNVLGSKLFSSIYYNFASISLI